MQSPESIAADAYVAAQKAAGNTTPIPIALERDWLRGLIVATVAEALKIANAGKPAPNARKAFPAPPPLPKVTRETIVLWRIPHESEWCEWMFGVDLINYPAPERARKMKERVPTAEVRLGTRTTTVEVTLGDEINPNE